MPREYGEAYLRAYRRSMAEHPTELMSPARPGKRALELSPTRSWARRLESALAGVLTAPQKRRAAGTIAVIALLALSYGVGRLLA